MTRGYATALTCIVILLPNLLHGRDGDAPWVGTYILLKQAGMRGFSAADAQSRSEPVLTWIVYEVQQEKENRVCIVQDGTAVWVAKDDVLQPQKAVPFFTNVIGRDKSDRHAYASRAVAWHILKQYDRALADHNEAIRLDPRNAEAIQNRASTWLAKGETEQAIADYSEAIRLRPGKNGTPARLNRATAWMSKGELDKALAEYSDVIRIDPTFAAAYGYRANIWLVKMEYDKALGDLSESVRLDPRDAELFRARGRIWIRKGECEKALADLNESIRLNPKEPSAYSSRALVWGAKGEIERALGDCDNAIRTDRTCPWGHYIQASILGCCPEAKFRDGRRAIEAARRACELTEWKNPGCLDVLASAYAEAGDFKQAVLWSKKAIERVQAPNVCEVTLTPDGLRRTVELEGDQGKESVTENLRSHLRLYEEGKPYHWTRTK
jgi:tetratricopeptide (TPR) repeat protein